MDEIMEILEEEIRRAEEARQNDKNMFFTGYWRGLQVAKEIIQNRIEA